jgi:hypothetical protein
LQAYYHLEDWWAAGEPEGEFDVELLPFEHQLFARRDKPAAFEHYRAALLSYYEQAVLRAPMSSLVRSYLRRLHAMDASALKAFVEAGEDAVERFVEQRNNAYRRVRPLLDTPPPQDRAQHEAELRTVLSAWVDYFECDLPLWFLGVTGKALSSGLIEPTAFGGPNSSTAQGSLADSVAAAIVDTPLAAIFDEAYSAKLRNIVQHNDFRVDAGRDGALRIVSLTAGEVFSEDEVRGRLFAQQSLGEAVATGMRWARHVLLAPETTALAQEGFVGAAFAADADGPVIALLQLWCFRDLDPLGSWLDSAEIVVLPHSDEEEEVRIGEHGVSIGPAISTGPLGDSIRERGWVRVMRIPIAPALGLGHPTYDVTPARRYEVVGPLDDHWIPATVAARSPL